MATKKNIGIDRETAARLAAEYDVLRIKASQIDKRKKEIAEILKTYAKKSGTADTNGSYYVDVEGFTFGAQCKKSVKFSESAANYLISAGFDECVEMTPKINEDAVYSRVSNGDLTVEELESITETSVSYSVSVKAVEEMPEVQCASVAASTKKRSILSRKET